MAVNTNNTRKAQGTSKAQDVQVQEQGTSEEQDVQVQEQGTQADELTDGMAALLAAAVAQGAQAASKAKVTRWTHKGYGAFVTAPEGHALLVRYDEHGRELASWWCIGADGTWAVQMKRRKDLVAWLDEQGLGNVAAQAQAARALAGGEEQARKVAQVAKAEVLAHAKRLAAQAS